MSGVETLLEIIREPDPSDKTSSLELQSESHRAVNAKIQTAAHNSDNPLPRPLRTLQQAALPRPKTQTLPNYKKTTQSGRSISRPLISG